MKLFEWYLPTLSILLGFWLRPGFGADFPNSWWNEFIIKPLILEGRVHPKVAIKIIEILATKKPSVQALNTSHCQNILKLFPDNHPEGLYDRTKDTICIDLKSSQTELSHEELGLFIHELQHRADTETKDRCQRETLAYMTQALVVEGFFWKITSDQDLQRITETVVGPKLLPFCDSVQTRSENILESYRQYVLDLKFNISPRVIHEKLTLTNDLYGLSESDAWMFLSKDPKTLSISDLTNDFSSRKNLEKALYLEAAQTLCRHAGHIGCERYDEIFAASMAGSP